MPKVSTVCLLQLTKRCYHPQKADGKRDFIKKRCLCVFSVFIKAAVIHQMMKKSLISGHGFLQIKETDYVPEVKKSFGIQMC